MVEDGSKYFEDFIIRKEGKSNWVEYWVVLRGPWMLFYKDRTTTDRDNFKGSIELTPNTKWSIAKRRSYNFPFYVSTARGTHLFKCQSNILRHQWLYAINLAAKGVPPIRPPSHIPPSSALVVEEGEFFSSWDSDKTKQDDDDVGIPPGVILVTALPNDLSDRTEDGASTNNNTAGTLLSTHSSAEPTTTTAAKESQSARHVPGRAVTSTGILGASHLVVPDRNETQISQRASISVDNSRTAHKPFGRGTLTHGTDLSRNRKISSPWSLSVDRPNSSPQADPPNKQRFSTPTYRKLNFSRHMARSAPDVQVLSLED